MGKRFTIALPVRNGGEYIKLAVASVMAQTVPDFELVVLDNASTDGTSEWLDSLRDERVRVIRSERSLSIEENWHRIVEIPKREFLTCLGHDDLLHADFLAEISRLIEQYPDGALYQTHFEIIDADGNRTRPCLPMPAREAGPEFAAARFAYIRDSYGTGYVIRSVDYDSIGGMPCYAGLMFADDALWLQALRLRDRFKYTSQRECFSYRFHPASARNTAPQTAVDGMAGYVGFLRDSAATDPLLSEVLARYAEGYFLSFAHLLYRTALAKASARGEVLDSKLLDTLAVALDGFVTRPAAEMLRESGRIRLLERINRSSRRKILQRLVDTARGPRARFWARLGHQLSGLDE